MTETEHDDLIYRSTERTLSGHPDRPFSPLRACSHDMDIERFLNVRSAYGASLGPDGEGLAFLMDTTGVPQVWTLAAPGTWPEQCTFFEERLTFVDWSPERDELVFGMDQGGNERQQLFRLDGGGGEAVPLTDDPAHKHRWGGWRSDGERFAFAANRRDESVFDLHVQDRDATGDEAELVHEGEGWLSLAGWSPDDGRLAVHRAYSNYDHDVYVFDLDAGELRHVTPHEGDVRYWGVEWGPAAEALYVTTDLGADTMYLARLDLDTLDVEPVVEPGEWNVEGVTVHRDTGRAVFSRNVEGYTELSVGELDGTSFEPLAEPDLPPGVYGGVDFAPDGDRFALTVTGRTRNANVHVVDVETGAAERWTHASMAGIPRATFSEPEVVRFPSFDDREIPGFLSLPTGADGPRDRDDDAPEPPYPVIVDVHGGPESQRRPSFSGVTGYFLDHGYAVYEPNVRGSTGYGKAYTRLDDKRMRMDSVADLAEGVRWLADRDDVDEDRIVALGASYGGFMVLSALTEYPELWAAGVDIVGIANFVTFLENTGEWRRELREAEYGSLEDDREFLESISPLNTIERIRAPLFVLHGENDPRVPVSEAHQLVEAASEHVPVRELVFEDEGHGFTKLENRIAAYEAIVEFLDDHVGRSQ